jgi:hypothetical protein
MQTLDYVPLSCWCPITVMSAAALTASPLPLTALRSRKASRRGQIVASHTGPALAPVLLVGVNTWRMQLLQPW